MLPFTKQSNHLRDLQRVGRIPQFGSFIYSAKSWYDKGILISIDKYSPMQFDRMEVILSSNTVGVFNIEIRNNALGISNRIAHADVKMEELLQAQYQDRASLSLCNDQVKLHLESLLYQINKKCVDCPIAFLQNDANVHPQVLCLMFSVHASLSFPNAFNCISLSPLPYSLALLSLSYILMTCNDDPALSSCIF